MNSCETRVALFLQVFWVEVVPSVIGKHVSESGIEILIL